MTTLKYEQLKYGPIDEIDFAIWNGDIFHNRENIRAFRVMMAGWELGLQDAEDLLDEVEE